jgi:hypothetical protein
VSTRLPLIESVPIELPGASVPPLMVVEGNMPLPPMLPPAFTVSPLDDAIEPFTESVPALTVVGPVYVLMPASPSVPVPAFTSPPLPSIEPAKLVEFAVPTVSELAPSWIVDPATPLRSLIVWLPELAEISKVAPAPERMSPLELAMLPLPDRLSNALSVILVEPV